MLTFLTFFTQAEFPNDTSAADVEEELNSQDLLPWMDEVVPNSFKVGKNVTRDFIGQTDLDGFPMDRSILSNDETQAILDFVSWLHYL